MTDVENMKNKEKMIATEDLRRMQAEINQLLNQRHLVTAAAITLIGVFCPLMIPKDSSFSPTTVCNFALGAADGMLLLLLLLFFWNRCLANLQANVQVYLRLKKYSQWQEDWATLIQKPYFWTMHKVQGVIFLILGVFTFFWPLVVALIYEPCPNSLPCLWMIFHVLFTIVYLWIVYAVSWKHWLSNKDDVTTKWRDILNARDPLDGLRDSQVEAIADYMLPPSERSHITELEERARDAENELTAEDRVQLKCLVTVRDRLADLKRRAKDTSD